MDPRRHAGEVREEDLRRGKVGVLVEEVVLGDPDVLEPGLDVVHQRGVLEVGVFLEAARGDVSLKEDAELHRILLSGPPRDGWSKPIERVLFFQPEPLVGARLASMKNVNILDGSMTA